MGQRITENPSFIIDVASNSRRILWSNEAAIIACGGRDPIGASFDKIVYVEKNVRSFHPAFFKNQWYSLTQETVIWNDQPRKEMILQKRQAIPDEAVLKALENMIGILLHRLRSPLTGIQGYANLMEHRLENKTNAIQIDKINKGIDELFTILDNLETLQKIPRDKVENNTFSADPVAVIGEILSEYPSDIRENITFVPPKSIQLVNCSPGDFKRILLLLLSNAIQHAPVPDREICIELPSATSVKVSHNGKPIPPSLAKELFFPFVTSKVTKLGIGLTAAMLYAQRYNGSIFLTDNSLLKGVSFTFCLPPKEDDF